MKRKNQLIENLQKQVAELKKENQKLRKRLNENEISSSIDIKSRISRIKYIKEQTNCSLRTAVEADNRHGSDIIGSITWAKNNKVNN